MLEQPIPNLYQNYWYWANLIIKDGTITLRWDLPVNTSPN